MSLSACISGTAAELGLKESDVREIVERVNAYRKRQVAAGTLDRIDEKVRGYAANEAERVKLAAALKRKQAALNIILRDEWERDLAALHTAGLDPREAVLAKLVGSYHGVANARKSASARRIALEGDWHAGMLAELRAEVPHVVDMLRRPKEVKPLLDDVVREWRKTGSTKNKDAATVAGILAKYAEAARIEANRAGANIGRLDGWGGPQAHDEGKLLKAGKERWVASILPALDLERSFGEAIDATEAARILGDTFDTIVTGRGNRITGKEKGERVGPGNLARSLEKHRVLHFKDADAWIGYNDQFGRGNVVTGMLDHLHSMARTVANMQTMGPNPEVFLDAMLETARRAIREGKGDAGAKAKAIARLDADLGAGKGTIGKAFVELMGDTFRPHNLTVARWGSGIRAVESMSKLGGAVISSITDLATYAHSMRFQGRGLLESYGEALGALFGGGGPERTRVALLMGVGSDALLGDISARFHAEDNMPGKMSAAMNTFFKLSGLNWWTERLTNAFTSMASSHMAMQAALPYAELGDAYRHVLSLHGLDEARWGQVRQLVSSEGDYTFIRPDLVRELPDDAFTPGTPRQIERARRELELDLRSFFADEASFAVLRGDDRTRMFTTQGTSAGTAMGEAIRFMMQFKTFPVAYAQKILAPALRGRGAGQSRDWGGIAHLVAASWALGYVAMTTKDFLKNRTMKDPTRYETLIAALIQGGGAGIYGDFLFAKSNRFGGGPIGTLAGPALGVGADAITLWQDMVHGDAKAGDAFYLALNNTPFLNLWYSRAALDLAVLNQVQEMISPGTLQRREKRLTKDFGQRYLVDPTPLQ